MKRLSRFLSVLVSVALLAASSVEVTAKPVATENSSPYSEYISQSQISSFINEEKKVDSTCPWTSDTKVSKTIPTYDLNNKINGLIVDLTNQNNPCGYIVYAFSDSDEPVVSEFGYDNEYTSAGKSIPTDIISNKKKLIHVQMLNDLISNGTQVTTLDGTKVKKIKTDIQKVIDKERTVINKAVAQLGKTLGKASAQKIYKNVNVTNVMNTRKWTPVVMDSYPHWSHAGCTVICGVNMLNYWYSCRNVSGLFSSADYVSNPRFTIAADKLGSRMHTVNSAPGIWSIFNGTYSKAGFSGMGSYLSNDVHKSWAGDDYANKPSWSWITANISHNIPLCLNADVHNFEGDTRYGGHSFFAIGFQETSTGNYIRVINEWDTSVSHFYNYSTNGSQITSAWYYRW
jgi:hypothetical protein